MTDVRTVPSRRARRSLALALVLTLAWLAGTGGFRPAFACSCAEPDLAPVLAGAADVALVVAERLDLDGGPEGELQVLDILAGGPLTGPVDARFDDGGSCDPGLAGGAVGALLLARDGDRWTTTTCGQVRVGDAFAAVGAPADPAPGAGEPTLLLGGDYGGPRLATVDAAGRVTTWAGDGDGRTTAVDRCPGDEVLVEVAVDETGSPSLHRWSLPDLRPVDGPVVLGPDHTFSAAVRCLDAEADRVLVVLPAFEEPGTIAVVDRDTVDARPAAVQAAAGGGDVVAVLTGATDGHRGPASLATVTETGELAPLATAPGTVFDRIAVSPSGAHVAAGGYPPDGDDLLLVATVADGHTERRVLDGFHQIGWLDDEHLWSRDEGTEAFGATRGRLDLFSTDLFPTGHLTTSPASGLAMGLPDGGVLVFGLAPPSVSRDEGTVRVADVRLTDTTVAVPLDPDRVLVEAVATEPTPSPSPSTGAAGTTGTTAPPTATPDAAASSAGTAARVAALAMVLLVGAVALGYRRRRGRDA